MDWIEPFPEFRANLRLVRAQPAGPGRSGACHTVETGRRGDARALDRRPRAARADAASGVWDPDEFLSPLRASAACRSTTRQHPFGFGGRRGALRAGGGATSKIKGGNSNWRGPVWFPTSFLMIESLREAGQGLRPDVHGDDAGAGGRPMTLREMAREIADRHDRASSRRDADGRRPVFGGAREVPGRTRTGATTCFLRVLPRRQRRRPRRVATRRAGPAWWRR